MKTQLHASCVNRCFDITSPTAFTLWDSHALDPAINSPFEVIAMAGAIEVKVIRSCTETFPLRFGAEARLYRVFTFRLFVDTDQVKSCRGFEF